MESFGYDAYGQVLSQSGVGTHPMSSTYDLAGNRITLTTQYGSSASNAVTTWEYDSRNRVSKKIYADSSYYQYTFDASGNLASRRDGKAVVTTYDYNAFNKLTLIDYPTDADVTLSYDGMGRRISMTDGSRGGGPSAEWTYDVASRVSVYTQNAVNRSIYYYYNAEGLITLRAVGDDIIPSPAWINTYAYDAAGRMTGVDDGITGEFSYAYHPDASLVSEVTMPGGAKQTKAHDELARLTEIKALNSTRGTVNRFAYGYDKVNQRQDVTLASGSLIDYGYDNKRQLTSAVSTTDTNYDYSYQFDNIGNWLTGETGNGGGGAPVSKTFSPNSLNQYRECGGSQLHSRCQREPDQHGEYDLRLGRGKSACYRWLKHPPLIPTMEWGAGLNRSKAESRLDIFTTECCPSWSSIAPTAHRVLSLAGLI